MEQGILPCLQCKINAFIGFNFQIKLILLLLLANEQLLHHYLYWNSQFYLVNYHFLIPYLDHIQTRSILWSNKLKLAQKL